VQVCNLVIALTSWEAGTNNRAIAIAARELVRWHESAGGGDGATPPTAAAAASASASASAAASSRHRRVHLVLAMDANSAATFARK
jgi:hypothetical protein